MQPILRILPPAFLLILLSLAVPAQGSEEQKHAREVSERRLLGLIEYISGDYSGAVADGKVLSETEFAEMTEFGHTAAESFKSLQNLLPPKSQAEITDTLQKLNMCIADKCQHEKLLVLTHFLRDEFIRGFGISPAPSQRPSFAVGKDIFARNCASCHGLNGHGDGPLAPNLKPTPRSFHDAEYMRHSSPFKYYNTLHTGITGTAMASFEGRLTQDQMWSVSFYIMGLRHQKKDAADELATASEKLWGALVEEDPSTLPPDLAFLARHSDQELETWITKAHPEDANLKDLADKNAARLSFLRAAAPYAPQARVKPGLEMSSDFPWDFVREHIQKAKDQFAAGSFSEATATLLDAYLEGFETVEAPLAVVDHSLLLTVERTFSIARTFAAKGNAKEFEATITELEGMLDQAQVKLLRQSSEKESWGSGDFISALIIILREGFEAFLIIVALLMIVKNMNAPRARLWIHAGWMLAVVFGFASYILFEKILKLSGATRESVEAFCTLAATIVLFYTGFWLLSQAEHSRWQKYIKARTGYAITKQRLWILAGISFIAVFRESAETVLFYSALLTNAQSSYVVLSGFLAGLLILFVFCLAILKFNVRLPLKQFFFSTSLFMVVLSVVLAGKSMNELIAAGYIRATPMRSLPLVDFLGLYPLRETFLAQSFVVGVAILIILKKNFSQSKTLLEKNAN